MNMKKYLLSCAAFAVGAFCYMANGFTGKEDITASKLKNADFSADKPVAISVRTYSKDIPESDGGAGAGGKELYGMQPVTGWTANYPSDNIKHGADDCEYDAKAAGIFPIYDQDEFDELPEEELVGLGGAYYAKGDKTKQALGIVSVWSGDGVPTIYSQDVTLPAGAYMLVVSLYNAAGTAAITNYIGFDGGEKTFYSNVSTYPVGEWVNDTIMIQLDAETAGKVTLGIRDGGVGSTSAPHIFIENVKLFTVDPAEITAAKIAEAKKELLAAINLGKAYNVDTSAAEAVYNNPNATLEEVLAAIEKQNELNESGVTDLSPYFIVNPHFDLDEPVEGGIATYDYDCEKNGFPLTNYSMLPVTGWERTRTDNGCAAGVFAIGSGARLAPLDNNNFSVPNVMSDGSTEGKVLGFVAAWSGKVQYLQAVTLPAGEYTLSMSYFNAGGTSAVAKNLIGFIADDGTEYLASMTSFPEGKWTTEEIKFTLDEETSGNFSLGYTAANAGSPVHPHFYTDGISLVYVGSGIDPSMFALKSAVSGANKVVDGEYYTELKKELQAAIEAGQKLIDDESTDSDANIAAYEKLVSLTSAVNANKKAYESLDAFYNDEDGAFAKASEKYDEDTYPTLKKNLDTLGDGVFEALMDYTWSTEQINNAIASLDSIIINGVKEAWDTAIASDEVLDNDIDISVLFEDKNVGRNGNYTGWKTTKGSISIQYNVGEIYNNTPFTVSNVITGLPKGKYTVTTKGFYRIGQNEVNYDEFSGGGTTGAYVYAGAQKSEMTNVAAVTFNSADVYPGLVETTTGSGIYVINNREGAQQLFNGEDGETFQTSASTVLLADGDSLTFGVCADEMQEGNWVTWYEFSISYNGMDVDDINAELIAQIEALEAAKASLEEYLDDVQENVTSPVYDAAQEVIGSVESVSDEASEAVDSDDEAAITKAIELVKATMASMDDIRASVEKNVAAVEECKAAREALDDVINSLDELELTPSGAAIDAAQEMVDEKATDDAIAELTTEEVKALTEEINAAKAALYIPADVDTASDDNPVDMTGVIANADIEQGGTVAWQYTKNGGNGPALGSGIEGQSIEFWNEVAANLQFNLWQVISAPLPAGTYELQVTASNSLNGQAIAVDSQGNPFLGRAYLYAETANADGETTQYSSDPVEIQEEGCTEKYDDYTVIFTVEEGQTVTVGIKSSGTMAARWFVADNFKLTYYGAASSKENSGDPAGIEALDADATEIVAIYTVSGAQVSALQKGLNIVKYADGTVKKVLVK